MISKNMMTNNTIVRRTALKTFAKATAATCGVLLAMATGSVASLAAEPLKVVTTMPDLAEMVRDVGQGEVKVTALLSGKEDAHYLDAQPNFITQVASADAVCFIGLELESSWLSKILSKSANRNVQPGGKGYCETGKSVKVIGADHHHHHDRSHGHVHAAGNPHFNLSPIAMQQAAKTVYNTLVALRPGKASVFKSGLAKFNAKMAKIDETIKAKFDAYMRSNSKPPKVIEYHEDFAYFLKAYNIQSGGAIEALPGMPPSATHLAKVAVAAKNNGVTIALGSLFTPKKHLEQFKRFSGIPYAKVPTMVQRGSKTLGTIAQLQEHLAKVILEAHQAKTAAR